ncbi:peptide MFS transporter [Porticoccus sp. W117]|uniref:peptide MFS transporter n=1 Tax=Porticoccus sp. W117 TaxID=3054777 RepID=UPI0025960AB2|nr:peptide MFS transporter [Porticoccus sp. W117]MDM3872674.1 peptide MFS transporter [Porticoccus sp. W117]
MNTIQSEDSSNSVVKTGHPKGLYVCFMTEMWERFSYYGMRALLIFYLTKHFLFGDNKAYAIYGAYTSMVYLMPVIGGIMADRYLGARKAVTFGAILLVLGHFGMAFEGPTAVQGADGVERHPLYLQIFYLSLALIITGVGFLKANISTIVGSLYEEDDPRRDGGFTIFYMGINLGSFIATLLCGWLGETYGWGYGFGLAGIGMVLGLIIFLRGQHTLDGHAEPPEPEQLKKSVFAGISVERLIYIGGFAAVLVIWQLVQHQQLVGQLLGGFGALMVLVILWFSFTKCDPVERDRMMVASGLIAFSVLFWALFEQAGSSLNIYTDRSVDRMLFGWEIKASQFQSLNALFIIALAPLFSALWIRLAAKGLEPSTPAKFGFGLFFVGLGFLVLSYFGAPGESGKSAMVWVVMIYLLHTIGELCLSPVGLSMITKLSVARVVGMMMGTWFLASAGANFIASQIASLTSSDTSSGEAIDVAQATANTLAVYADVGWLAVGVAAFVFVITPLMRKGMHGVH